MQSNLPEIGSRYTAKGPLINKNRGLCDGSEWILTCDLDGNLSLVEYANNGGGFSKLTIAKPFFGENFRKVNEFNPPDRAATYRTEKHFYPDVNVEGPVLLPV